MAEKKCNWVAWVAVLALVLAVVALVMVLAGGSTGEAVYSNPLGSLQISSIPSGADVYLDEVIQGTSPMTIGDLSQGEYTIKVAKNGYDDYSEYVYIYARENKVLRAELTPSS